jgi:hypothetical protein
MTDGCEVKAYLCLRSRGSILEGGCLVVLTGQLRLDYEDAPSCTSSRCLMIV